MKWLNYHIKIDAREQNHTIEDLHRILTDELGLASDQVQVMKLNV